MEPKPKCAEGGGEPERIRNPKGLEAVEDLEPMEDLEPGIWSLNSRTRRIWSQNLGLRGGTEPKLYRLEGEGMGGTGDLGFGMDLEPGKELELEL